MKQADFTGLGLRPELTANLATLGYAGMTPIQAQSLPPILAGSDVIGQARTGSGKTAAFGLGILHKLDPKFFSVQALVLCPTRELADQVAGAIRELARTTPNVKVLSLCGGQPLAAQATSLRSGAHIVVGTPGRLADHLRRGTLDLANAATLVLDEADRMLEMGFQDEVDAIVDALPGKRQTLLFSATFPEEIRAIAGRVMRTPVRVSVADTHGHDSIRQHFYKVAGADAERLIALRMLLLQKRPESAVVFCATRAEVDAVTAELRSGRFSVLALHGALEQRDRDATLTRFANKSVAVLVATDVAARGLDIDSLDMVVNFRVAPDPEVHVHRIGRTGRAGSSGLALTLYSDAEAHRIARLEAYLGTEIRPEPLPGEKILERIPAKPPCVSLRIDGGRKQKLRPGDILGALTAAPEIEGRQVGKINLFDQYAFVAVDRGVAKAALAQLTAGKLKGRSFRVRRIGG